MRRCRRFVDLRALLDEFRVERTQGGFVSARWGRLRGPGESQVRPEESLSRVELGEGLACRLTKRIVIQDPMNDR